MIKKQSQNRPHRPKTFRLKINEQLQLIFSVSINSYLILNKKLVFKLLIDKLLFLLNLNTAKVSIVTSIF